MERAKAFTKRLADCEDVEAENRAFALAAEHKDLQRGLAFLMDWPAVAEAGRMIEARLDDIRVTGDQVELWAPKLRRIKPCAAYCCSGRLQPTPSADASSPSAID